MHCVVYGTTYKTAMARCVLRVPAILVIFMKKLYYPAHGTISSNHRSCWDHNCLLLLSLLWWRSLHLLRWISRMWLLLRWVARLCTLWWVHIARICWWIWLVATSWIVWIAWRLVTTLFGVRRRSSCHCASLPKNIQNESITFQVQMQKHTPHKLTRTGTRITDWF